MPAMGNFTSAAAGGFAGKGILPDGYNDMTHTGQHMTISFGSIAVGNILTEFEPEWGPLAQKLRVPKLLPPWWTPRH
jgi:hypothetical protein